jgi:hypothetical protein
MYTTNLPRVRGRVGGRAGGQAGGRAGCGGFSDVAPSGAAGGMHAREARWGPRGSPEGRAEGSAEAHPMPMSSAGT